MSFKLSALVLTPLLLAGYRAGAGPPSALGEMRQAAAAAAEVEPERVPPPRLLLGAPPIRGGLEESRRDVVRQAVRTEVEREWTDRAKGRGPATLPPGQGGQPPGQTVSAQARAAAAQAQEERRSKDVAQGRGRGKPDEPPGKGGGKNGNK